MKPREPIHYAVNLNDPHLVACGLSCAKVLTTVCRRAGGHLRAECLVRRTTSRSGTPGRLCCWPRSRTHKTAQIITHKTRVRYSRNKSRKKRNGRMHRGFAVVALHNPKNVINVGHALRAAGCFEAAMVVLGGERPSKFRHPSDPQKSSRHMPVIQMDNVLDALPYGAVPVAVEVLPDAMPLPTFTHPPAAFYIFGPEDGSLPEDVLDRCTHKVTIPTAHCLNLGMAVNVVLYDRAAKLQQAGTEVWTLGKAASTGPSVTDEDLEDPWEVGQRVLEAEKFKEAMKRETYIGRAVGQLQGGEEVFDLLKGASEARDD